MSGLLFQLEDPFPLALVLTVAGQNVLLPLNDPLSWPAGETPCAADSWPVLYGDGEVTVRLMDLRTHPGDPYTGDWRLMYLCVGNASDQAASVEVTALDVDACAKEIVKQLRG